MTAIPRDEMWRRLRIAATLGAALLAGPPATSPARADTSATTVIIAGATAGAATLATLLVKDYFDDKAEEERLQRETDEILEEAKRINARAEALEFENTALLARTEGALGVAEFWSVLLREDEEFFKPGRVSERVASFEAGLETLFVKNPALFEKVHLAMSAPAGDWERALLLRAYGAGLPGADIWELRKRVDLGLEGGVVLVAGEREARYISGAENMMAVVDYAREVAGEEEYRETLQKLWGCAPEEVAAVLSALPEVE